MVIVVWCNYFKPFFMFKHLPLYSHDFEGHRIDPIRFKFFFFLKLWYLIYHELEGGRGGIKIDYSSPSMFPFS